MSSEQFITLAHAFALKRLPGSEIELQGEVPFAAVEPYRTEALGHLASHLELPGFRAGHVPADVALKKIGESAVLEEAVERFMRDFYPALVTEHKADVVGQPNVQVTKLAEGNPVGLLVRTAVYPEVVLPKNWRILGETVRLEPVPDTITDEVDNAITSLRRARAKAAAPGQDPKAEVKEEALPALDDAFAQGLGNFKNLEDLKIKIKENVKLEKEQKAKDKRRGEIINVLLKKISIEVPIIFVESELQKIMGQLKEDVTRFGLTFDGYLKQVGKTEEQLRGEFRDQAHKRATLQLALNKIAEEAKIEPEEEAVKTEMEHALKHFPDARPELLKVHIETIMRNERALQLLEGTEEKA
ncbi:hypothetical protein HYS79_02680 [Patescibacteria group bacterium]|nr:hypothetical protein [Patescibacteria group bacterium]